MSKASLMRWNKRYDGTRESLADKSHRPHRPHPRAHTEEELNWIKILRRRNPNISLNEMYGKMLKKGYQQHPGSLYRVFVRLGYRKKAESAKKKSGHLKKYDTPSKPGIKRQLDVKYVPQACYAGQKFYQYTMVEEASRMRYIRAYKEQSGYSTVDFVREAIRYFGYQPKVIQTDNGAEFTNTCKTKRIHAFDIFCRSRKIVHQLLRPRTPWHNGKVERSHRNDQERFYNYLRFYSYDDLQTQMTRYLRRSNQIPMSVLGWKSPLCRQAELLRQNANPL